MFHLKRIHIQKKWKMKKEGFSLIESLISMTLFSFMLISCLDFFCTARSHFFKLKSEQENKESAFSALDKIRNDLLKGGLGLIAPSRLGIIKGIRKNESGSLIILSKQKELDIPEDLLTGQTRISIESEKNIKKGREICIFDTHKGEIRCISSIDNMSIILTSPLSSSYQKENTNIILLKKVTIFFDKNKSILRRKVNSSPSQPLIEEVAAFEIDHEEFSNLVKLHLILKTMKEEKYEISVFPKNTALIFFN